MNEEKVKVKVKETPANVTCTNDMTLWKIIWSFISKNKVLFTIYLAFLFLIPVKAILLPRTIGKLHSYIHKGDFKDTRYFAFVLLTVVVVLVLLQVMYTLCDIVEVHTLPRMQMHVRNMMVQHQFDSNATNYNTVETGRFVANGIKLPMVISSFVQLAKNIYIPGFITLTVALIYITIQDWWLGFVFFIVLCTCFGTLFFSFHNCQDIAIARDHQNTEVMSRAEDILRNIMSVMSLGKEGDEMNGLSEMQTKFSEMCAKTVHCSVSAKYIVVPLGVIYMLYLCYHSWRKKYDGGKFVTLLIIMFIIITVLFDLTNKIVDLLYKYGVLRNGISVFESCTRDVEPYGLPLRGTTDGITFQDVSYSYMDGRKVFENLNMTIGFNETTLIVGSIGSGKSTMLSLLLRYYVPQRGEIFYQGTPYTRMHHVDIRKRIMHVPQSPALLNRSIYENVIYGTERKGGKGDAVASKSEVTELFISLGLASFLATLPNGLDTSVGVGGSSLSGGQRQIVWIVKLYLLDPEVVLLDEPTASIDEETKALVVALLERIVKDRNRTCILVTHDPYLLRLADVVITLDKGSVASVKRSS
jgi:ATP-binding cassette subfamily B protein